jgi:hypothetical protein
MPVGGIPTLEAALPLGLPRPIALPPVEIASINDTCGNFSGWEAFSIDELIPVPADADSRGDSRIG